MGVGVGADERLDAAHAGADRALAEQLDDADLADARRVRADAELARPLADGDDADPLAVLLAEERHRAELRRASSMAMTSAVTGQVVEQHGVDPRLDLAHAPPRAPPAAS